MNEWTCADENMQAYRMEVRKLENKFEGLELVHILWHNNKAADELANLGSKRMQVPTDIFVEHLTKPTVEKKAKPKPAPSEATDEGNNGEPSDYDCTVAVINDDWRTPIIKFLTEEVLPTDKAEAERVSPRSYCYFVSDEELLRQSVSGILMRCVLPDEGNKSLSRSARASAATTPQPRR
ncbi:uncharacterized protein LOC107304345 [Oryza brachyantha]|uniref:uncharacterized protein LOC107304345 n=1 Tax=Oryza brachyantha TaxID=4533 RepID=UPI0007766236|nr:uncharacterized protein LOC107304345 [Oryza brachyantha]